MTSNGIPSNEITESIDTTLKKSNRYRMVALDLDGTLLSSDGKLDDIQAEYFRGLSEKGFLVCLATGRSATGTYISASKLQIPRLPIVCSNGSRGILLSMGRDDDPKSAVIVEEQFHQQVPKDIVQRAIDLANKHGFCVQYYYKDSVHSTQSPEIPYTMMNRIRYGRQILINRDDYKEMLEKNQLPSKLLLLFNSSDMEKALQVTNEEFAPSEATIIKGDKTFFLEILNATSNKGIGLRDMCEKLQVPLDKVIAIGDGWNDIEFLQMAGLGVAVKNAEAAVKEIADINLDFTNDEHGPMRILQELEEKGDLIFQEKNCS